MKYIYISGKTPNAFIGLSRNHDDMQQLHLEEKGFAAAKTLYISDSVDKRKQFDLYLKVLISWLITDHMNVIFILLALFPET